MNKPRKASSMGKRKIDIEKGEKPMNIDVCFSKRRSGLFKKASELCILTGAQVAIIAFSTHGNPYLFGHPSADSVIDHYYVNGTAGPCPGPIHGMNGGSTAIITTSHEHARLAEEMETWKLLLKKEKELKREQQTKKEAAAAAAEEKLLGTDDYYKEWFKTDNNNQENMSLEELESLRDEWKLVREKVVNKLGIMERSYSMMAASSSCGGSSHANNNNGVNGSFYVGSSSSSSSTFYDPMSTTTGFTTHVTRHGHEEVNAGMGMDVFDGCLDVFESLPPLLEEDYLWDF